MSQDPKVFKDAGEEILYDMDQAARNATGLGDLDTAYVEQAITSGFEHATGQRSYAFEHETGAEAPTAAEASSISDPSGEAPPPNDTPW